EVPSPTFTIIETYDPPAVRLPLVHADFYRLEHPAEAEELGLDDYREGAVLLAEWPEKAGGFSSEPGCLAIKRETAGSGRRAIVEPGSDWLGRLPCAKACPRGWTNFSPRRVGQGRTSSRCPGTPASGAIFASATARAPRC